jgi:hypothetical protein
MHNENAVDPEIDGVEVDHDESVTTYLAASFANRRHLVGVSPVACLKRLVKWL